MKRYSFNLERRKILEKDERPPVTRLTCQTVDLALSGDAWRKVIESGKGVRITIEVFEWDDRKN